MHERKGGDGRDYAIAFEMRLPLAWNGRFYYQGNGGLDGAVVPALGALGGGPLTGALAQGFAVISSDAGHTGPQTPFFGLEAQARLDYGYQAVAKLTPMAKALIAAAYGRGPDRSYIGGCSNGGRHAPGRSPPRDWATSTTATWPVRPATGCRTRRSPRSPAPRCGRRSRRAARRCATR